MPVQKQRKVPGKNRKPGESFNISERKEAAAKESGRLDSIRTINPYNFPPMKQKERKR